MLMVYYTDKKLQFPVAVDTPDPIFAKALEQGIGGVKGEIRAPCNIFFKPGAHEALPNTVISFSRLPLGRSATLKCWQRPWHSTLKERLSQRRNMLRRTLSAAPFLAA
jgi:manganese containing catalase